VLRGRRQSARGACYHSKRQSGQYPVAANATPATAKSAAPISIPSFILRFPQPLRLSVARVAPWDSERMRLSPGRAP
jgi:hypothetical protein